MFLFWLEIGEIPVGRLYVGCLRSIIKQEPPLMSLTDDNILLVKAM